VAVVRHGPKQQLVAGLGGAKPISHVPTMVRPEMEGFGCIENPSIPGGEA
jgi:hypothetical protein